MCTLTSSFLEWGDGRSSDLQLFDGVPSFPDDQAHFAGGDKDLLDGVVAVHVVVEARPVPTSLHDLPQQSLRLPDGQSKGRNITKPALSLHGMPASLTFILTFVISCMVNVNSFRLFSTILLVKYYGGIWGGWWVLTQCFQYYGMTVTGGDGEYLLNAFRASSEGAGSVHHTPTICIDTDTNS